MLSPSDVSAISDAVRSTFVASGPHLEAFESEVSKYCGRKYGIAVTNGTSGLQLAVRALNLPRKSKILIPSFTIVSVLHAVLANDHVPVFVDVDRHSWNITKESVDEEIRRGIDAAIIVETYASSPRMREISTLMQKHKIPFIEDSAEGFGGKDGKKHFGSFGDMSVVSFYANKLITTGEGGMVLTDDRMIADEVRSLRNLFFDADRKYIHVQMSGNFRMTNIQAALGLSQLSRVDDLYAHRRKLYQLYLELLKDLDGTLLTFQHVPETVSSSYWVFPVLVGKTGEKTAVDVISELKKGGIDSRHFFYPLDRQPFLKRQKPVSDVSLDIWQRGLYLPLGNGITEDEVRQSAGVLRTVLRRFDRPL